MTRYPIDRNPFPSSVIEAPVVITPCPPPAGIGNASSAPEPVEPEPAQSQVHLPPVEVVGDAVVLRGDALLVLRRALGAQRRQYRSNGTAADPMATTIARAIVRATSEMSASGHNFDTRRSMLEHRKVGNTIVSAPGSDLVGTVEFAHLLGITPRQARRVISADPQCVRVGASWALPRSRAHEIRHTRNQRGNNRNGH